MSNDKNAERYEMLKAMLEDRRREIQDKLRSMRESLPAESLEVRDAEEQSVNDFVQDIDFALMQMKAESLRKMDEALLRLEDGTYGSCTECSAEIGAARLKAVPFADRCIACQEQAESAGGEERGGRRSAFADADYGA
jgi:DnaK suppressor protein